MTVLCQGGKTVHPNIAASSLFDLVKFETQFFFDSSTCRMLTEEGRRVKPPCGLVSGSPHTAELTFLAEESGVILSYDVSKSNSKNLSLRSGSKDSDTSPVMFITEVGKLQFCCRNNICIVTGRDCLMKRSFSKQVFHQNSKVLKEIQRTINPIK